MDDTKVTRNVETDLPPDELWALVADGAAWPAWMVDEADLDVGPGATGTVVEDGVERSVRIDHVGDGCVDFTWWPRDREELASTVELVVLPRPAGSLLQITERFPAGACASQARAAMAWELRTLLLVLGAAVPSGV